MTFDDALRQAAQALNGQRPDLAEALVRDVLKAHPSSVPAAHMLGAALVMKGQPAEAVQVLEPLARPGADPAIPHLLARALAATGRHDEALQALRLTVAARPPYPPAFLELGIGLTDLGRLDEALAIFETGLGLMPQEHGLRIAEGYLHLQRGDAEAAKRRFGEVLNAASDRPDALVGLAKVSAFLGHHAEAVDLYGRALALRPGLSALKIDLARSLLELNRRDEAEAALRAAEASPNGPALAALTDASHGRLFLRPSAAARFLKA